MTCGRCGWIGVSDSVISGKVVKPKTYPNADLRHFWGLFFSHKTTLHCENYPTKTIDPCFTASLECNLQSTFFPFCTNLTVFDSFFPPSSPLLCFSFSFFHPLPLSCVCSEVCGITRVWCSGH